MSKNCKLYGDLEYIVSGWYTERLDGEDVQEMAAQLHDYIIEQYGPPF